MVYDRHNPNRHQSLHDIERPCYSNNCNGRVTRHTYVVYHDEDFLQCSVCQTRERTKYKNVEDFDKFMHRIGMSKDEVKKIRGNLLGVTGDLQTRKWGRMGSKDKSFIRRIIERLLGIGRDMDIDDE